MIKILDEKFIEKNNLNSVMEESSELITLLEENNIVYKQCYFCDDCKKWTTEPLTYITDKNIYVCEDCIEDSARYFLCEDCEKWYSKNTEYYYTHNDECICENCYNDSYFTCYTCDEIYHVDDIHEFEGEYYCESCYENATASNLMSYHSYHNWTPLTTPDEPEPPFYIGHELEIDEGSDQREAVCLINRKLNCICMEDGSLSEDGIEIISQPLSYNYMLSQEQNYRDTFAELANSYYYTSHNNDTCGLHFHVSRPQNEEIIDRILLFMETYKEEIIKISRRTSGEIESWCNFLSDRRTNITEKEIKSLDYIKKYKEKSSRYMALNLTNSNTIEFRIFKGTLKYETFMADFEFVYNLTLLASDLSIPIEELTWTKVTSFGRFLPDYIREHNLQSDKPIYDYTQEIIVELNRQKEELQKQATTLLKELFDVMKKSLRKNQKLDYNNLFKIHDVIYYGNVAMNNIREVLGKLEYGTLDSSMLNELKYTINNIQTYINNYVKKEEK